MAHDLEALSDDRSIEMPRPTAWPMVVAVGLAFGLAGVALSYAMLLVGAAILIVGLVGWVLQLLPGKGHAHEPRVAPEQRARSVAARLGTVAPLEEGVAGYRLRLPVEVHPTSAGIWGGLAGMLVMPVPALLWGVFSGHGIWYPINLLAGMAVPGIVAQELDQFHPTLLLIASAIHVIFCVVVGLCYGVLMPTLPDVPMAVAWGGLLMPILWTAVSYGAMSSVNPVLARGVDWPWFIASQFVFGIVSANVFRAAQTRWPGVRAGLLGGLAGGGAMPLPALLWGLVTRHGIWYPINLLAALAVPDMGRLPAADLESFNFGWLLVALALHVGLSLAFGLAYSLVLPRLRPIPGPLAWGGLVMPMLWTGTSYGLMGVVNPLLRAHVDWPWFVFSQFVFGVAAALVVVRSEKIPVPPVGAGRPGDGETSRQGEQP